MVKLLAVALWFAIGAMAQDDEMQTGFLDRTVDVGGETRRYVVYVPDAYRGSDRAWPLIVFLNGRGECGTDGKRQAEVGLGAAIRKAPERWPFVVVFPQKPDKNTQWVDHEDLVAATMAKTQEEYRVDREHRFLTGLSQGGCGTWEIGSRHAETWAAIAPICGYRSREWQASGLQDTPVWAFHGDADPVVPVAQTRAFCKELEAAGGKPLVTIYPGVNHNSWDRAYGESALAEWFRLHAIDQPLVARYLAHPDALQQATLEVTLYDANGEQGEHAGVHAAGDAIGWFVRSGALDGPAPRAGGGVVGRATAEQGSGWHALDGQVQRLLRQPLQQLARSGALSAALTSDTPLRDERARIVLRFSGAAGAVRHVCALDAETLERAGCRAALAAIVKAVRDEPR